MHSIFVKILLGLLVLASSPASLRLIVSCMSELDYAVYSRSNANGGPSQIGAPLTSVDGVDIGGHVAAGQQFFPPSTYRQQDAFAARQKQQQQVADRLRELLMRGFALAPTRDTLLSRQVRSSGAASSPQDEIIGKWLESTLVGTDGFKRSDRFVAMQQQTGDEQQQDSEPTTSTNSISGSSGHKTIRNIMPVFMRLPPRFGKRAS